MIVEITACPSCTGKIQQLKGGKFFCEACDTIFRITREGPRVETVGALEQLTDRVDHIEKTIGEGGSVQDPKPAADSPQEQPVADPDDDDEQLLDDSEDLDSDDEVNELWGD